METKLEWAHNKMKFEIERQICDDDWKAEFDLECEAKQAKGAYESQAKIKFSSPDFSGARLWCNLAAAYSGADGEKALSLEKKVNISYEDEYHVGYRVKHDTEEITEGWAQAVWTPKDKEDTAFWIRGDKNQSMVSLGASLPYEWNGTNCQQSYEASYSTQEGFEGVKGQPVVLRGGYEVALDDRNKHAMWAKLGRNFEVWNKNEHKIDDHWTFGFKQRFDSSKLGGKDSQPYDIGFSMTYKL